MKATARTRQYSGLDKLLGRVDESLRSITGNTASRSSRPNPAADLPVGELSNQEKELSGRLMRINHCGEVCAQALYLGQSLTSSEAGTRDAMKTAAEEEIDHLGWCEQRLAELDSNVSHLNPAFFLSSLLTGMMFGLAGDKYNLGFVAATEEQVVAHLEEHLHKLPDTDLQSRAIVAQMKIDEDRHRSSALRQGGVDFPRPVKRLMTLASRVMTRSTYWI